MWPQNYTPIGGNVAASAIVAALPVFVVLVMLGWWRKPAWMAALAGTGAAAAVAIAVYRMPPLLMISAAANGAAFGLFPIAWIVFWAVVLYRVTVETGKFEIIKDSVGHLTEDRRLQALLIAFAFGAFIEGAAGFGTPVAVAAGMLAGLGFSPFYAAGICLIANTAPVAFGSIGIPVITLAGITGLSANDLSANVGRICAPVSLIVPGYLILVIGGVRALRGVWPAALACGVAFAGTQLAVSNLLGPQLTDILSSLAAIAVLVALLQFWRPSDHFELDGDSKQAQHARRDARTVAQAWAPYGLLVVLVLLWGWDPVKRLLNAATISFAWPALHNLIERVPPVVGKAAPYGAVYTLNVLSASGTACMLAAIGAALITGLGMGRFVRLIGATLRQLSLSILTIASVLALAYLMNYSGATATMGLAFAATGAMFPFFSAMLGWLGVFLTGSDTSANALFGNLQVVTATQLHMNPLLMAAANSSGGVMGKMISLQSIAVAAAATGMNDKDQARLFRFTLKHSVLLASLLGLIVVFYAYAAPHWVR